MIVGISTRVVGASGYIEARDALSHDWTRLVDAAGGIAVAIPNALGDPASYVRSIGVDALVLSGGESCGPSIDPLAPGYEGELAKAHGDRDRTERALFDLAMAERIPLLGVCRGFQLGNLLLGGAVAKMSEREPAIDHLATRHAVALSGPLAADTGASNATVNSFHGNVVVPSGLGRGLTATAFADDGTIEAVVHENAVFLGVQWHPERPGVDAPVGSDLVRRWLASCA